MPQTEVVVFADAAGNTPLWEWLDGLPAKVQDKLIARIDLLQGKGHELRRPHADTLRDGIHELRAVFQRVNYRLLYFFAGQRAVISHGITKEGVVPPKEMSWRSVASSSSSRIRRNTPTGRDKMATKARTSNAADILRRRYVGDDAERKASVEAERVNADVAQLIYDRRTAAGLTQKQLAELIGTTQSVISRLESADYEGHSLTMLERIGHALDQRVSVRMAPRDSGAKVIHFVFREVIAALRKRKGLTVDEFAAKLELDRQEIVAMERDDDYRPKPLTLYKLSRFHGIPQQQLAALAGAISEVNPGLQEQASRFAARSESFAKLTTEEKRTLDEFVKFLKSEA